MINIIHEQEAELMKSSRRCNCKCCGKSISINEKFFRYEYVNRYGGLGYINICCVCIDKLYHLLNRKELKKIKAEVLAEKI